MKVKPDPNCRYCHGTGIVYDLVDWWGTTTQMPSYCGCIEEQLIDVDEEIELEVEDKDYVEEQDDVRT